ncbi:RuvC family protein [Geomonas propionica]|uniref:Uncharacterized protein n=1 Tax=Geomonas propionica TaxID=2798582 RepID=A0ABS0YP48_9BACT|nr:hypothetical protein [Geomonas propionica]MBJ6799754.1 hypothetical protein [Geomonas propionica]
MQKENLKYYLGIDPGKKGALSILRQDGTPQWWARMPQGKPEIIDTLVNLIQEHPHLVMVVELAQAMPGQGVTSCFRYGHHFATFEDVAILLKIPYHEVRPAVWKKVFGLSSDKRLSTSVCRRIFPKVDLIPPRCRTDHDGIAEALLIAEWGRRRNL